MKNTKVIFLTSVTALIFIACIFWVRFTDIGYLLIGSRIFEMTHRHPKALEWAYISVAMDTRWPELCYKISPKAYWTAWFTPKGYQIWLLRSECFYKVAFKSRNSNLCREVKAITNPLSDGSTISRNGCLRAIKEGDFFLSKLQGRSDDYKIVLQQMGYSLESLNIPAHFRKGDFVDYRLFFLSLGASRDFQERFKSLPDFSRE